MTCRRSFLVRATVSVLFAAACGAGRAAPDFASADDAGSEAIAVVPDAAELADASVLFGDASWALGALAIIPAKQTLDVTYGQSSPTLTLTVTEGGHTINAPLAVDRSDIGTIDSSGVFKPNGLAGGTVTVTAMYGGQKATAQITVVIHLTQNGASSGMGVATGVAGNGGVGGEGIGGPVTSVVQTTLQGQPAADSALSWLYPYDQTVWPRGLLAPLLQWTAPRTYDAVFIHLKEAAFEYTGFFSATAMPFVHHPIPQPAWDALSASNGGEAVSVSLVFAAGGKAYGPLTETWKIARDTLKGTVYYQSYGTNLAHNYCCAVNGARFGGATLAIKHGAAAPVLVAGNDQSCRVCHSVSADGSRLITQQGSSYWTSSAYDLRNGYAETPMMPADGRFGFAALSPNGQLLLTNGVPSMLGPGTWDGDTQLFSVPGGSPIASTGVPAGLRAGTPAFSPDGRHVTFTFVAGPGSDGRSLAIMDYAAATSTFSNLRVLYTPPSGMGVWPSFMPTSNAVVFERETLGNGRDFGGTRSACDSGGACSNSGTQAELWWVDVGTKAASPLSRLNGSGYLPTMAPSGHTDDASLNYQPTVSPFPSGGYAWVVFTSRRLYGNVATINPYWSDPRFHDISTTPTTKKLWAAALDLSATPGSDPSHPAFYMPGQELLAGNSRGFWVFDACQGDGGACGSGDECCGGYCTPSDGGGICSAQPPPCSNELDKCAQTGDCCGASLGITCTGGVCSRPTPQ
jgi:hypothetical protein